MPQSGLIRNDTAKKIQVLITIFLFNRKAGTDAVTLGILEEPWDALTLFQRWLVRSRVAGAETSGLDLGDTKLHVEALEKKLQELSKVPY